MYSEIKSKSAETTAKEEAQLQMLHAAENLHMRISDVKDAQSEVRDRFGPLMSMASELCQTQQDVLRSEGGGQNFSYDVNNPNSACSKDDPGPCRLAQALRELEALMQLGAPAAQIQDKLKEIEDMDPIALLEASIEMLREKGLDVEHLLAKLAALKALQAQGALELTWEDFLEGLGGQEALEALLLEFPEATALFEQLQKAIEAGDFAQVAALLEQLQKDHPALAQRLAEPLAVFQQQVTAILQPLEAQLQAQLEAYEQLVEALQELGLSEEFADLQQVLEEWIQTYDQLLAQYNDGELTLTDLQQQVQEQFEFLEGTLQEQLQQPELSYEVQQHLEDILQTLDTAKQTETTTELQTPSLTQQLTQLVDRLPEGFVLQPESERIVGAAAALNQNASEATQQIFTDLVAARQQVGIQDTHNQNDPALKEVLVARASEAVKADIASESTTKRDVKDTPQETGNKTEQEASREASARGGDKATVAENTAAQPEVAQTAVHAAAVQRVTPEASLNPNLNTVQTIDFSSLQPGLTVSATGNRVSLSAGVIEGENSWAKNTATSYTAPPTPSRTQEVSTGSGHETRIAVAEVKGPGGKTDPAAEQEPKEVAREGEPKDKPQPEKDNPKPEIDNRVKPLEPVPGPGPNPPQPINPPQPNPPGPEKPEAEKDEPCWLKCKKRGQKGGCCGSPEEELENIEAELDRIDEMIKSVPEDRREELEARQEALEKKKERKEEEITIRDKIEELETALEDSGVGTPAAEQIQKDLQIARGQLEEFAQRDAKRQEDAKEAQKVKTDEIIGPGNLASLLAAHRVEEH